jgi:hypothetical protein
MALAYYKVCQFDVHYGSVMFYSTGSLSLPELSTPVALPANIRLDWKRLITAKHSSLLRRRIYYDRKKIFGTGPGYFKSEDN